MSFGSGPSLDENFDLEVGSTGDVAVSSGIEELHKDLSLQLSVGLQEFVGATPTPTIEAEAVSRAKDIMEADVRVDRVLQDDSSAEFIEENQRLKLSMKYIARNNSREFFALVVE
jgi:hypothetical protein